MNTVFIATKKLIVGNTYKSGLMGGTIVPINNKIQLDSAIKFQQRSNAHYERNESLYFNYLDESNVCVKIEKVV